jgi:hypothetical protein
MHIGVYTPINGVGQAVRSNERFSKLFGPAGTVTVSVTCLPGQALAKYGSVMTTRSDPRYAGYRFPAEIIATAVWLVPSVFRSACGWWLPRGGARRALFAIDGIADETEREYAWHSRSMSSSPTCCRTAWGGAGARRPCWWTPSGMAPARRGRSNW